MDRRLLARNLLILQQLEELLRALAAEKLPVVLLKGAALIALSPEYAADRTMEDIDLLCRPADGERIRRILNSLGYAAATNDPAAFRRAAAAASIDLTQCLWYLSGRGNEEVFRNSMKHPVPGLPGAFHMPPSDFYCHILAHAAVHHARQDPRWQRDLQVLSRVFDGVLDMMTVDRTLKGCGLKDAADVYLDGGGKGLSLRQRLYLWLLNKDIPLKGHVTRFLFMPSKNRISYLGAVLFPPKRFLERRYSSAPRMPHWILRACRPFLLCAKLAAFLCSIPLARREPRTERPATSAQ